MMIELLLLGQFVILALDISSLWPIAVIVILIAAAAGLSRGANIFAIFGIGSLMGITGGVGRGGGAGKGIRAGKPRSIMLGKYGAAKVGGKQKGLLAGMGKQARKVVGKKINRRVSNRWARQVNEVRGMELKESQVTGKTVAPTGGKDRVGLAPVKFGLLTKMAVGVGSIRGAHRRLARSQRYVEAREGKVQQAGEKVQAAKAAGKGALLATAAYKWHSWRLEQQQAKLQRREWATAVVEAKAINKGKMGSRGAMMWAGPEDGHPLLPPPPPSPTGKPLATPNRVKIEEVPMTKKQLNAAIALKEGVENHNLQEGTKAYSNLVKRAGFAGLSAKDLEEKLADPRFQRGTDEYFKAVESAGKSVFGFNTEGMFLGGLAKDMAQRKYFNEMHGSSGSFVSHVKTFRNLAENPPPPPITSGTSAAAAKPPPSYDNLIDHILNGSPKASSSSKSSFFVSPIAAILLNHVQSQSGSRRYTPEKIEHKFGGRPEFREAEAVRQRNRQAAAAAHAEAEGEGFETHPRGAAPQKALTDEQKREFLGQILQHMSNAPGFMGQAAGKMAKGEDEKIASHAKVKEEGEKHFGKGYNEMFDKWEERRAKQPPKESKKKEEEQRLERQAKAQAEASEKAAREEEERIRKRNEEALREQAEREGFENQPSARSRSTAAHPEEPEKDELE